MCKKLAKLVYKKHAGKIEKQLRGTGFQLVTSIRQGTQGILQSKYQKVVVAYRGTDSRDRSSILEDVNSDQSQFRWCLGDTCHKKVSESSENLNNSDGSGLLEPF